VVGRREKGNFGLGCKSLALLFFGAENKNPRKEKFSPAVFPTLQFGPVPRFADPFGPDPWIGGGDRCLLAHRLADWMMLGW